MCGSFLNPCMFQSFPSKQTHRYREQTSGYQWEKEGGPIQGWEIKRYKLLGVRQATRMSCTMQGM